MTGRFRVTVVQPNGTRGVESRKVRGVPEGLDAKQTEQFVRDEWAKGYPYEKYESIEADGNTFQPAPGKFPAGVRIATA